MQNQERFASWEEVDGLLRDVGSHLNMEPLIYGRSELQEVLAELSKEEEFRDLILVLAHPRWDNDPTEKKLTFLSKVNRRKVVEAMANVIDPCG